MGADMVDAKKIAHCSYPRGFIWPHGACMYVAKLAWNLKGAPL